MLEAEKIKENWERYREIVNTSFPTRKDALNKMYDELENIDDSRENIDLDDWLYLKYSFLENIKKYAKKSR